VKKLIFFLLIPIKCYSIYFSFVQSENLCPQVISILESGETIVGITKLNDEFAPLSYLIFFSGNEPYQFKEIDVAD